MKKVTQIFIFAFFLVGSLKMKAQKSGYVDYKSSGAYINLSKCLLDDVLA